MGWYEELRQTNIKLFTGDEAVVSEIARLYAKVWKTLEKELNGLLERISGGDAPVSVYYRLSQVESLMKSITGKMNSLAGKVKKEIGEAQVAKVERTFKEIDKVLREYRTGLNLPAGVKISEGAILPQVLPVLSNTLKHIQFIKSLAGLDLEKVKGIITMGIAESLNPLTIRAMLRKEFSLSLAKASLVARTELARAQNATMNSLIREYGWHKWERKANPQTACLECAMLDGVILDASVDFFDHPNGFCYLVPVLNSEILSKEGIERERGPGQNLYKKILESARNGNEAQLEKYRALLGKYYGPFIRGEILPEDMLVYSEHPVWGMSAKIKPMDEIFLRPPSFRIAPVLMPEAGLDLMKIGGDPADIIWEKAINWQAQNFSQVGEFSLELYGNAIAYWQGNSKPFQQALLEGRIYDRIRKLSQAIKCWQTNGDLVLFRGMTMDVLPKAGEVVEMKTFFATSADLRVIRGFLPADEYKGCQMFWRVKVPKGTPALPLNYARFGMEQGGYYSEQEVLLDKGTKFKINKISWVRVSDLIAEGQSRFVFLIDAEVIP